MNDKVHESFSAFLDGEATEMDVQRLLKAVEQNPALLDDWHRMSKIQAAMAGDTVVDVAMKPAEPQSETGVFPKQQSSRPSYGKWLAQSTIAAAVAVMVVVGVQWFATPETGVEVADSVPLTDSDVDTAQARFEAQQRLNSFLREHAEAASYRSGHAVVPVQPSWEDVE